MTKEPKIKDWLTHDEVVGKIMLERGLTREEAEKLLEQFDKECPWAVDEKPPQ